ncbi:hypothetical protein MAH1_35220 [Sessilibacter sp. MAH1]
MYDVALSLGTDCQTRYNISKYIYLKNGGASSEFLLTEKRKNVSDYGSFFFDWCVSTLEGVCRVLEGDFSNVLLLENLFIEETSHGTQHVVDKYTGFQYPHSFPGSQDNKLTYDILTEHYPLFLEKTAYIINKTRSVLNSSKRKLLICRSNDSCEVVENFLNLICSNYSNFHLVYINSSKEDSFLSLLDKYHCVDLYQMTRQKYPGCYEDWENILSNYELTLPNL